jgi:hypothetical protein
LCSDINAPMLDGHEYLGEHDLVSHPQSTIIAWKVEGYVKLKYSGNQPTLRMSTRERSNDIYAVLEYVLQLAQNDW